MQSSANSDMDFTDEIKAIEKNRSDQAYIFRPQSLQRFSCPGTPTVHTLLTSSRIFTTFEELHGDRLFRRPCPHWWSASIDGQPVMVIALKGRKYRANRRGTLAVPIPKGTAKPSVDEMANRFNLPIFHLSIHQQPIPVSVRKNVCSGQSR